MQRCIRFVRVRVPGIVAWDVSPYTNSPGVLEHKLWQVRYPRALRCTAFQGCGPVWVLVYTVRGLAAWV